MCCCGAGSVDLEAIRDFVSQVPVEEFSPSQGVKIAATDEEEKNARQGFVMFPLVGPPPPFLPSCDPSVCEFLTVDRCGLESDSQLGQGAASTQLASPLISCECRCV